MKRTSWLLALGVVFQCAPPFVAAGSDSGLDVEYAGCAAVIAQDSHEPVCEVRPGSTLIFWVRAPTDADLTLELDGEPRTVTATVVQDGLRFPVPQASDGSSLLLGAAFDGQQYFYHLALAPYHRAFEVEEAHRLRKDQKPEAAIEHIESSLKAGTTIAARAELTGIWARIDKLAGRPETEKRFLDAIELDRRAGLIALEIKDRLVLSLWYGDHGEYGKARGILEGTKTLLALDPQGRAMEPNYRGNIYAATGDLHSARNAFYESELASKRLHPLLDAHLTDVYQNSALVLAELGRYDEALQYIDAVDTEARRAQLQPRQLAQLASNVGQVISLAQQADGDLAEASPRDPIPHLMKARALLSPGGEAADPNALASVELNLALVALRAGRLDEARGYVEAAQASKATIKFVIESSNYIWAELALAENNPQLALEYFDRMTGADLRVRVLSGRARALEMLDLIEESRDAHRKADELLSEFSVAVPLGQGRSLFLERHREIPSHRIDFLARQAQLASDPQSWLEEALSAARVSNGRLLRSLCPIDQQAREQYQKESAEIERELEEAKDLASNEQKKRATDLERRKQILLTEFGQQHQCAASTSALVDPAPEELLLVYHPTPSGWVGFAGLEGHVLAARIGPLPAARDEQAVLLLQPFAKLLEQAKRVRVGSSGLLQHVDFENLPWQEKTLLAVMPVTRGLDIPARVDQGPRPPFPSGLIIADPNDNFELARKHADVVNRSLTDIYPALPTLIDKEAIRDRVLKELQKPELELLHYTGHGWHSGRDGWLSAISLHGGVLNIADIVALSHVPRYVILASCSTAATDENLAISEFGVAQAFVSKGAEFAIAPTRKVLDEEALRSIKELYADPLELLRDPANVIHQIAARSQNHDPAGFRVVAP